MKVKASKLTTLEMHELQKSLEYTSAESLGSTVTDLIVRIGYDVLDSADLFPIDRSHNEYLSVIGYVASDKSAGISFILEAAVNLLLTSKGTHQRTPIRDKVLVLTVDRIGHTSHLRYSGLVPDNTFTVKERELYFTNFNNSSILKSRPYGEDPVPDTISNLVESIRLYYGVEEIVADMVTGTQFVRLQATVNGTRLINYLRVDGAPNKPSLGVPTVQIDGNAVLFVYD